MGLDASGLKDAIEGVLTSEPPSIDAFAGDLAAAIIGYLGDVVIDYPAAPGINPAGPTPDPSFSTGNGEPVVPPSAQESSLKAAILASCNATEAANERDWSAADAGYATVIVAIGASWKTKDAYMSTGATAPGPTVGFADALAVGDSPAEGEEGGTQSDVAQALADAVDATTTGSTFTGAYLKGAFVGAAPQVSALS